jgi:hypothetical protein
MLFPIRLEGCGYFMLSSLRTLPLNGFLLQTAVPFKILGPRPRLTGIGPTWEI